MRLRLLISAAALLALAACSGPSRPKTAAVSVPVVNANCPSVPLSCPPAAAPVAAVAPPVVRAKAVKHRRHAARRVAAAKPAPAAPRQDEAQALLPSHPMPYSGSAQAAPQPPPANRYVERREDRYSYGGQPPLAEAYPPVQRDAYYPPNATGRDAYGFLTWPGKVPARP